VSNCNKSGHRFVHGRLGIDPAARTRKLAPLAGDFKKFDIAILRDCGAAATVFRNGYGKFDRRITVEPIPSSRVRE
jgi:hypothetical protein